ncbi:WD40 repeat-like protein [Neolentinus lepideus HHB14362 ss-1]|uniref:WD repeat-containing protein JIP5 n=1 Tax=Neolentinus lepideus HHB14362 ss-1 TaxID=1314782 RepID=A0A165QDF6_9AGAM|nr:WD40 repeat-like protein [Neolentinus lepideus HHB14362 ss-1]
MPDIQVGAQVFDCAFHPTESLLYAGLLNGEVKAFRYDDQGQHEAAFTVRPSKKSCRALETDDDGSHLWAAGKGKGLHTIDISTHKVVESRKNAHEAPINRIKRLLPHMLATGDDDGVVKLWDPRKPDAIRTYTQHYDFISDFLWLEDKKHLIASSGDGTLSVMDVRSSKPEPHAQSEDQEDELLSMVTIKDNSKVVVGTQLGMLSIFNRKSGWGDCVDRVPGHPHSIDALSPLPSTYPSAHSTILTGSSDGLVRAVQLFPTKLLGVVADHGEFPVERIKVDRAGQGRWVASVGHEEVVRMTDLREVFEDEEGEQAGEGEKFGIEDENDSDGEEVVDLEPAPSPAKQDDDDEAQETVVKSSDDEGEDSDVPRERKRKRKKEKDPLAAPGRRKKGRNEVVSDPAFFADL